MRPTFYFYRFNFDSSNTDRYVFVNKWLLHMYQYSEQDRSSLRARGEIFQRQLARHLEGKVSDEDFRPIRLQQGLYIQRHAPMLRIAIPYGMVSAKQLRALADVAHRYDKDYCHITTRQNVQFNWLALNDISTVLTRLAKADLHSIQTSGNCIRNITSDPFAGVVDDEVIDPRPYCELIRQWSLGHPEFAFLPRKFKISITGSKKDRAIIQAHDIGLRLVFNAQNEIGFQVLVGGGLGRTPVIGTVISLFVPEADILDYLTSILRVYNQYGRRDNKYKARIKILVKAIGIDHFRAQVEQELNSVQQYSKPITPDQIESYAVHFKQPEYDVISEHKIKQFSADLKHKTIGFKNWYQRNTQAHKVPGYRSVTVSLKDHSNAPGDIKNHQLQVVADLCEAYSFGVARTTHEQNMVLADVRIDQLDGLWQHLNKLNLASPNIGTINDMICCPGLDFCSLANTQSIPVAQAIQNVFSDMDYVFDIGDLTLNISGCMNACAHHHLANIGILGVDKKGQQFFQISLGGQKGNNTAIGKILGPAFKASEVPEVIEKIIQLYLYRRGDIEVENESFIDTISRVGIQYFKEGVYDAAH
jgi:sulfite reductase (NADPH) hemoprotein beta-component